MQSFIKNRHLFLLILLVLFLLLPAFISEGIFIHLLVSIILTLILVQSVYISYRENRKNRIALWAGVVVLLSTWMEYILPFDPKIMNTITYLMIFAFFIYIVVILLKFLVRNKDVNLDIIYASISIYFLIGILGGFLFVAIDALYPAAFTLSQEGQLNLIDYIYYSFITMCTIGYGDITPSIRETQVLSFLLGVTGQLYLAIIVAILVGKYISRPRQ